MQPHFGSKINITNASRGTANAWHFYHALVFCDYDVMREVRKALAAP
ncbi:DUF3265 domain-containing protein [Vibrio vulnificus]|nr:DUF3265 domain-containing protein [Vibrio vulnificus]